MFVLDVVPLTNIPIGQPQIFSYFSKNELKRGFLVEVPLGRRKIIAVVLKSENISSRKASLKAARFSLKPISKIFSSKPIVPPLFFILADFISRYYFTSISLSLKTILPSRIKSLIKHTESLTLDDFPQYFQILTPLETKDIQIKRKGFNFSNDFGSLLKEVKDCLEKKQQVLILVPTILHQKYYYSQFSNSIKESIFIISNDLKVKEFNTLWQKINSKEALIALGRRSSLFLPWQDLGLVVVIDGNNSSYKSWDQKPYYNSVTLANYLSLYYDAKITCYQNY
jgi:primosomal protein N' (replication factor Y)